MRDRATVLRINSVGAVGALSVIPAQAGIHATAQPCDEPPSARRPTRAPSAPRVIGSRRTSGVPMIPTDRLDSCLRRNDGTSSSQGRRNIQGGRPRADLHRPLRSPPLPAASPPAERGESKSGRVGLFRAFRRQPSVAAGGSACRSIVGGCSSISPIFWNSLKCGFAACAATSACVAHDSKNE